jgi:hypothetical protein
MVQKYRLTIKFIVGLALCYPQLGHAEAFTGKQFLQWEERNQDMYISSSVVMMVITAGSSRLGDDWADCVNDWFFKDQARQLSAVKENIARFEDFQPQLTIYATAKKACGRF